MRMIDNFEKWLQKTVENANRDNRDDAVFVADYNSIEEIQNAADGGDGNACYLMAELNYYYGCVVTEAELAEKYMKTGIKANNRYCTVEYCEKAMFDDLCSETNEKHIRGLIDLLNSVADVSIHANYVLGMIYSSIPNCFHNSEKAVDYMRRAAECGDYYAIYELALWSSSGIYDVNLEDKFFFNAFLKSADMGYTRSMNMAATYFFKGLGCDKDYNKAFEYASKAANAGSGSGYDFLGYLYENGYGTDADINKAIACYKAAGEKGINDSYLQLGHIYYDGVLVPKDIKQAVNYLYEAMNFNFEGLDDTAETAAELLLKIAEENPEAVNEEQLELATDVYNENY